MLPLKLCLQQGNIAKLFADTIQFLQCLNLGASTSGQTDGPCCCFKHRVDYTGFEQGESTVFKILKSSLCPRVPMSVGVMPFGNMSFPLRTCFKYRQGYYANKKMKKKKSTRKKQHTTVSQKSSGAPDSYLKRCPRQLAGTHLGIHLLCS